MYVVLRMFSTSPAKKQTILLYFVQNRFSTLNTSKVEKMPYIVKMNLAIV